MEIYLSSEPKEVAEVLTDVVSCDAAKFAVINFIKFAKSQKDKPFGADIYRPFLKEIKEILKSK